MRFIGLDVHRDFFEVAICEDARVRSAGRFRTDTLAIELFAQSLGRDDQVALEVTGCAAAIAKIVAPHVEQVVMANSKEVKAIAWAKAKTDKLDAQTLARLLASGFLPGVWRPDDATRALRRRISRRAQLVRARTRAKNEIHAVLLRNLKGKPPVSDLFGKGGRYWLDGQDLPTDEHQTVAGCIRQIEFLDEEIDLIDRELAASALERSDIKRLMTIPGVGVTCAAALMACIGDIGRFPSPKNLVGYLGLDPRVRQSGTEPARHGRISKEGSALTRHMLVEAAWIASQSPGPLRAFAERIRARRGAQIAAVAVARKLALISWHMLVRGEDYAFARPSLTRKKLRLLELRCGAAPNRGRRNKSPIFATASQRAHERELAVQAEVAYKRSVADWQAQQKRSGAGVSPGRAS